MPSFAHIAHIALIALFALGLVGCDDPASNRPIGDAQVDLDLSPELDTSDDLDLSPELDADSVADLAPDEVDDWVAPPDLVIPNLRQLTPYVDPMIGTLGQGNVIPGALLPHGMVRVSPDTSSETGSIDSYKYDDTQLEGFTHLNLEGPGGSANGYSQILFMPYSGVLPADLDVRQTFSHDTEHAEPGYYSVELESGVQVELTATSTAGLHRTTFPPSEAAHVLIDLGHSNGKSVGGEVEVVGDDVVQGFGYYNVHPLLELAVMEPTGDSKVYFHATFDRPIVDTGTWQGEGATRVTTPGARTGRGVDLGLWLDFDVAATGELNVVVGISLISVEQAALNAAPARQLGFDAVRAAASEQWNQALNRIQVDGEEDLKTIFYTALYHSMFQPADYTEQGARFQSGSSGKAEVFEAGRRHFYTDDWCMWDTFRTSHPLQALIEPERRGDVIWSMLHLYKQGGWLPKCTWHATGYSRVMIGNHAIPIIADAYAKGLRDFDPNRAWEAIWKASTEDIANLGSTSLCGYLNLGTPPEYLALGYVPSECDPTQSVSMTLEYAYDDWAAAQFADQTGHTGERDQLLARSQNYRNHFNPAEGFMQAKLRDGSWKVPFDPADNSDSNDFCEADSWSYSFFVPHDVPGLIGLLGGDTAFVERLERFFDEGHFDASNEPSFHIPWLYNFAGAPERTQARVRQFLSDDFSSSPDGLPGNDDAGATSAWYVLAALGLYPVAPGEPVYQLSTPLFDSATVTLYPGFTAGTPLVIRTENNAPGNVYIRSVSRDGVAVTDLEVSHEALSAGGEWVFVLGDQPSSWGK
ncbi:MAG: hypothetical protein AUK47_27165 [Deltaproteobacteria bacterium CG2_30_63_29]|nr:MAG: hypothetical protein AUK47_27165 [Deltaproteobacteria bacterium CG2_30_63_29]